MDEHQLDRAGGRQGQAPGERGISRRRWIAGGAAAAVTGTGLAALTGPSASAGSGDALVLGKLANGNGNVSDDETGVWFSSPMPRGFVVMGPDLVDLSPLSGAVVGASSGPRPGVMGYGLNWNGVIGQSPKVVGVVGRSTADAGVLGESTNSIGVVGRGTSGAGVRGDSTNGNGVIGQSPNVVGVYGISTKDAGVFGTSAQSYGVVGRSTQLTGVWGQGPAYGVRGDSGRTGVWGNSTGPSGAYAGVEGTSTNNWGVHGTSSIAAGVAGVSASAAGVSGQSTSGPGMTATSTSAKGVVGTGGTYGGEFKGSLAPVRLVPGTKAGKPAAGAHQLGELYCDSAGALFFCTAAGTPGTWKKVTLT